jgi:hypothetical protein
MGNIFLVLLFFWGILCFIPAGIASSKGRSGAGFFMLSFFFSPLIGVIAALIASPAAKPQTVIVNQSTETKHNQTEDHVVILERLSDLKNKGLLTEEEFVAEKTKLLGTNLIIIFLGISVLIGCDKKYSYEESKPADSMMTPAPAPDYKGVSSSATSESNTDFKDLEKKYMVSSETQNTQTTGEDAYDRTEKVWDDLRSNEEKYSGKTVHLERLKVMSIYDDVIAYTRSLHYVSITGEMASYEGERAMKTPNYIRLHEDDWIDLTGKLIGVNSSGEVVIEMKKIKNLGIHPQE